MKITGEKKGIKLVDLGKKFEGLLYMEKMSRFKYLFPFYRMDINTFRQQLDKIKPTLKSSIKDTDFISLD